ncbi:ROK family protein [Fictibacillus iocasae]|uniref:ROK family protein n=1 Tax=Fictibacillus iocasae TaxID=2715437 RepID=A0ABW2NUW8_9BACL
MTKEYIIAVDIGGTNVEAALCRLDGEIVASDEFSTQDYVDTGLIEELSSRIQSILQQQNVSIDQVSSAGLGVPGVVNIVEGIVYSAPNLKWEHYHVKKALEEKLKIPVFVENDVNTGLLGEAVYGAAKGKRDVILIMVGTSIGAGLMLDGKLYRGSNFGAGEIGYMISDCDAADKGFTPVKEGYGFLSSKMGGYPIGKAYSDQSGKLTKTDEVFQLAQQGDELAVSIIDESVLHLGMAITNMVSLLNPELVLIGGGVGKSAEKYLHKIDQMLKNNIPFPVELGISALADQSVLYGAAALCQKQYLNENQNYCTLF